MRRKGAAIGNAPVKDPLDDEKSDAKSRKKRSAVGAATTNINPYRESEKKNKNFVFLVLGGLASLIIATWGFHGFLAPPTRTAPRTVHLPDITIPPAIRRTSAPYRDESNNMNILFPNLSPGQNYLGWGVFYSALSLEDDVAFQHYAEQKDFGGLDDLRFPDLDGQARAIWHTQEEREEYSWDDDVEEESMPWFFSFDDDFKRSPYHDFDDDRLVYNSQCRRPSWYRDQSPTCNTMHELDIPSNVDRFIGEGSFREVFMAHYAYLNQSEAIAFKETKMSRKLEYEDMENIRVDALVAERFSSNERFVNMFAYCGLSQVTELFVNGDIEDAIVGHQGHDSELDPFSEPDLRPRNEFTPSQKLKLALEMVEPLLAMHTALDGIIVHDDVDLGQFLWADSNHQDIKLNDFNRAEIMLWDEDNDEFCKYKNGKPGGGYWRSPEEYMDAPLNDKIDVWSVGNNIYSLVTGLYPYYHIEDTEDIQEAVVDGQRPIIDRRYRENSYAESKLVEIIDLCHIYDPDERPSMTDIQQMLIEAIDMDERIRKEEASQNE